MSTGSPLFFIRNFTKVGFGAEVRTEQQVKLKKNRFLAALALCAVNQDGVPIDEKGVPTGKTFKDLFAEMAKANGFVLKENPQQPPQSPEKH